jgi:hypothetical protein
VFASAVSPPAAYRPRHPEQTPLHRLLDAHSERCEPRHGPLRPVVPRVVAQYLDCGRLKSGFARLRCPPCASEHLLAFSCQTRNFCPSCQAKRAALLAERVRAQDQTERQSTAKTAFLGCFSFREYFRSPPTSPIASKEMPNVPS